LDVKPYSLTLALESVKSEKVGIGRYYIESFYFIFQLDNRGNRLLAVDDSGINTPAIAAAHAIKRYTAQAADEISLEVSDQGFSSFISSPELKAHVSCSDHVSSVVCP